MEAVALAAADGLADAGPVGGAEAGAGEAVALDEGFQEQDAVGVAGLPVRGQLARGLREQAGGQATDLHPRTDEEARQVGDQVEAGGALFVAPADEGVAVVEAPGGSAEAQGGEQAVVGISQITHLGSGQAGVAGIMVAGDDDVAATATFLRCVIVKDLRSEPKTLRVVAPQRSQHPEQSEQSVNGIPSNSGGGVNRSVSRETPVSGPASGRSRPDRSKGVPHEA